MDEWEKLVEAARALIRERYKENRHHIAAAVRGGSGAIYTGVHLDTYVGRASVCAEAVALGAALSAGEAEIDTIVSVRHPRPREDIQEIRVVSPCGICREMLTDFAPQARVLVMRDGTLSAERPLDLLPYKYRR
ncbi:MAG TPA: cytidine deaminase [Dongiaceae bacterium]|jgi:cytidine deaminase|nr:cytidine deaminase [Dongiaceae bacterium]